MLNTAVLAPIPSARAAIAATVNPGLRRNSLSPNRTSCQSIAKKMGT
jgi:hypothetical protein